MVIFKETPVIITTLIISNTLNCGAQSRWVKVYHDETDAPLEFYIESYDKGYLLSGKYGANYSKYNWLIKTDINGEVLWEKTIGDGLHAIVFVDVAQDESGNIYLCGSTRAYDPDSDPLIMKLNSCGEKEWCRIFYTEDNHDFASCFTLTKEGEIVIVLELSNPDHSVDRICLSKLTSDGDQLWKHCYTSADTSQENEDSFDLIQTPDQGFLVTGFCFYEDPTDPYVWLPHPYYLKVDSLGIFEWETVVFKESSQEGGIAGNTVVSPDSQYFYSSISHYYYNPNLTSPALVKMDIDGNVIGVYDVLYGYYQGKLNYAQFINDSTLVADAGWGNTDDDLWSRAVIIDTLGNLLNSTVLMEDLYTSILQVTFDGKLVYASNTYQNNQFDCYLTKLNQNLEDDTIYTRPFTYDSLCPYQISSDTIVQDDCGLIVGIEEDDGTIRLYDGKKGGLEVWPNPAREQLHVLLNMDGGRFNRDLTLVIYDSFGREVQKIKVPEGQTQLQVNVEGLPTGIYIVMLKNSLNILESRKFVISGTHW